jgi:hypothetical protein
MWLFNWGDTILTIIAIACIYAILRMLGLTFNGTVNIVSFAIIAIAVIVWARQ